LVVVGVSLALASGSLSAIPGLAAAPSAAAPGTAAPGAAAVTPTPIPRSKPGQAPVIRIYDPATNTFGAFNPSGATRTFFKPTSPSYWERQPGSAPWGP
jgi:hypothetical protein